MKPFERAVIPFESVSEQIEEHVRAWRAGNKEAREATPASDELAARAAITSCVKRIIEEEEVWNNGEYQVHLRRLEALKDGEKIYWPAMIHLSIRRLDRNTMHDWRVFQQIKNMLVGPEHEAVELYPSESRKVDSANQYHLWVMADPQNKFPFGFEDRLVQNSTYGRAKNRPL